VLFFIKLNFLQRKKVQLQILGTFFEKSKKIYTFYEFSITEYFIFIVKIILFRLTLRNKYGIIKNHLFNYGETL